MDTDTRFIAPPGNRKVNWDRDRASVAPPASGVNELAARFATSGQASRS
jgi:hypothetical protein